ncbi:hypothetical protein BDV23DRAFT_185088 [Aspergillus alliaceus]|uniref:Uncharacterized protein n=1 Tax=Petromyces alliaceus TaxID=209559 RepID=A0A5N7C4I2_PETAA|nr:hypothetical protein BDV23DRAFT_185088 [Aspergillus alliaceus]
MSGVVASFIVYGVLHMRGVQDRKGWRWLILIEALTSIVIGFLRFLFLVPGPTQTATWWDPKGYYTEGEGKIIVNCVLRESPSKGDMRNRQALSLKMLWQSLKDYDLWLVYIIGDLFEIPTSSPKGYLSLSLKAIGFATFQTTLLVAEGYEFQVRWKWPKNAVVNWDNRATSHTGIFDYFPHLQHGLRVAPQAEKPYLDPKSETRKEAFQEEETKKSS